MTPEAVTCAKLQHKDSMSGSEISHFLRHDRLQSPPGCRKIMFPDRAKFLRSHSRVIQVDLHWAIIGWDAFFWSTVGVSCWSSAFAPRNSSREILTPCPSDGVLRARTFRVSPALGWWFGPSHISLGLRVSPSAHRGTGGRPAGRWRAEIFGPPDAGGP